MILTVKQWIRKRTQDQLSKVFSNHLAKEAANIESAAEAFTNFVINYRNKHNDTKR